MKPVANGVTKCPDFDRALICSCRPACAKANRYTRALPNGQTFHVDGAKVRLTGLASEATGAAVVRETPVRIGDK